MARRVEARGAGGANEFQVYFWGVRGSVGAGGRCFANVGGNTSCVEVRCGDQTIILDGGSGLVQLSHCWAGRRHATFFFSHYHWDHIIGFPFFRPAYLPENAFTLYGPGTGEAGVRASLARLMQPPHFPIALSELQADLDFRSIGPGDAVRIGSMRVCAGALHHPQPCLGYRVTVGGASVVYATDTEAAPTGTIDPAVLQLSRGADVLIHDAQFTDDEYEGRYAVPRRGWGHASVSAACRLARAAGVKTLVLFHHDPLHDDAAVEQLERQARTLMPNALAAREGMVLTLPSQAVLAPDVGAVHDTEHFAIAPSRPF